MSQLRRVAIVGGNRIPFARSNTVYATASNQEMLTSALDGLVERSRWNYSDLGLLMTRLYSFGSTATDQASRFVASMVSATPIDVVAEFLPALQEHDKRAVLWVFQGVELLVVSVSEAVFQTLGACVERAHLQFEGVVAAPFASALAALEEDEMDLGAICIDTGVSSACSTGQLSTKRLCASYSGSKAAPARPDHCASVERGVNTPERALMASCR